MFGKSFIVSLVLKFIAGKGMDWLKDLSKDHKAEAKAYVEGLIPGTKFDALVWGIVEKVWDSILMAAEQLVKSLIEGESLVGEEKEFHKEKALAEAVMSVKEPMAQA